MAIISSICAIAWIARRPHTPTCLSRSTPTRCATAGYPGASVYILSERGASSEAARKLAEHENAADLKGGISLSDQRPDVRSVVLDVVQNANIGQSVEAADRVLGALDRVGAVRKREVQQAAFVVLKSPDMPSLLVETAYISNASEERKLRSPSRAAAPGRCDLQRHRQLFPQIPARRQPVRPHSRRGHRQRR